MTDLPEPGPGRPEDVVEGRHLDSPEVADGVGHLTEDVQGKIQKNHGGYWWILHSSRRGPHSLEYRDAIPVTLS